MIVAFVGCGVTGDEKTPESYNNVGYPLSEQTFECRMSRIIDDYIVERYGVFAQYKVENFNKYTEDTFNWPFSYTFTIILDIQDRLENVKTLEINCRIDYEGKNLRDYDIKQID